VADYQVSVRVTGDSSDAQRAFDKVQDEMRDTDRVADQTSRSMSSAFDFAAGAATGFLASFGAEAALSAIGDLNQIGMEVNFVGKRFEALTEDVEGSMDALRTETGGMMTDLELQREGVSLVMTGVVTDMEDAATLMSDALALGGVEGMKVAGQALRNQSYELLDSVGVSSGDVRALAAQYRAAGMDSAAAFSQAFMEVASDTREALGSAADAGNTAFGRIQVDIQNTIDDLGNFTADVIETGAELRDLWRIAGQSIQGENPFNPLENPAGWIGFEAGRGTGDILDPQRIVMRDFQEGWSDTFGGVIHVAENFADTVNTTLATIGSPEYMARQNMGDTVGILSAYVDANTLAARDIGNAQRGRVGDTELFTPDELRQLQLIQSEAQGAVAQLEILHETGVVTDEQLAQAQTYATSIDGITAAAERGVAARDAMFQSTGNLFGQVGGGGLGQMGDQVAAAMEAGGADEAAIAAMQDAFDFASGRETELSKAWEEQGLPAIMAIGEQIGEEAAVAAAESLQLGIVNARTFGTAAASMADLLGFADVGGSMMGIGDLQNIRAGSGFATQFAGESAESGAPDMSAMQGQMEAIADSSVTWNTNSGEVVGHLEGMVTPMADVATEMLAMGGHTGKIFTDSVNTKTEFEKVTEFVDGLTAKPHKMSFDIDAGYSGSTPNWFRDLFNRELAYVIANSGGAVPGDVDPRAE
jgi:hypothetical protein